VLAFTADGKTLVTLEHQRGVVRLWDVETGKERRSFQAVPNAEKDPVNRIREAAASPDGATLAVAYHQVGNHVNTGVGLRPDVIRLWDVAGGKALRQVEGNGTSMTFSPNGCLLVAGGQVWYVATGRRTAERAEVWPTVAFSGDGRLLATASQAGTVRIVEVASWTVRTEFRGAHERTTALAFTPSGQLLCGGLDTTVLAYDVRPRRAATSGPLDAAWTDLTNPDAGRAFGAQGRLLAAPAAAVKLFAEKIKPVEPADADLVRRLIADLDSPKFAAREGASNQLSELGERALPALEAAVATSTSHELTDRAAKVLARLRTITPEQLPQVRAVEVLERLASDEAKDLLNRWAGGVKGAVLTEEARAALGRLNRDAAGRPVGR
jgi:hypothetical protein